MSDDNQTTSASRLFSPTSANSTSAATTSSAAADPSTPTGHSLRRAFTIDDAALRRRAGINHTNANTGDGSIFTDTPPPPSVGRRSSNFSEYSFTEARGILNPGVNDGGDESTGPEASSLASLSLAFALLPALAGSLFKDGSAVVTDIMLLGLAGVFLHWSVTQPWTWYHSAQQVRVQQEGNLEAVIEDDSDFESLSPAHGEVKRSLDQVPEEGEEYKESEPESTLKPSYRNKSRSEHQQSALEELYLYEITSLISCFALPLISAYLLHAIRSQLSRPSEGLVSNYNLTIFLLISELRVFSHVIKLFRSRTLHLQRVVNANPYGQLSSGGTSDGNPRVIQALLERLDKLEARSTAEEALLQKATSELDATANKTTKQDAAVARDVRNAIQPELDALNRAVRRYEKKATVLQLQTESRFAAVDARLENAIALAAAAAKNSASRKPLIVKMVEAVLAAILMPFNAIVRIMLLPLRAILALVVRGRVAGSDRKPIARERAGRGSSRGGKLSANGDGSGGVPGRYVGDRVPSRVAKR